MINWNALQGGGFQGALSQGFQYGQMVRQQKDERDYRNALAQFDPSNPDTLKPIMAVAPEVGLKLQGQVRAQQAQAQQQQQVDGQTYVRLLEAAKDNPQQAYSAAQQMGLDLSGVPQVGTPEFETWRRNQLFVINALKDPEKLTAVQQDAQALGLDLNTPEGLQAVQELTLYKYAKNGVDEYGRPTLELPQIAVGGQAPAQQQPAMQQPSGEVMDFAAYRSTAAQLGPEKAARFVQRLVQGGVSFRVNTPEEARQLPSGTPIILPDGTPGVVP